jgi:hypothetical protein
MASITCNASSIHKDNMTIYGSANTINGDNNTIYGNANTIQGDNNTVIGDANTIQGDNNKYNGNANTCNGNYNKNIGNANKSIDDNNFFGVNGNYINIENVVKTTKFYEDGKLVKTAVEKNKDNEFQGIHAGGTISIMTCDNVKGNMIQNGNSIIYKK